MVYRKKRRPVRRKKKTYRRRKRYGGNPGGLSVTTMGGFPKSKVVKMRYNEHVSLNSASGAIATNFFRANSIFDPNQTGIGHQPLGRDQWELFYNTYTVIGAKVTVNFCVQGVPTPSSTATQLAVGIYLCDDTTVPTTVEEMVEQGLSKWNYIIGVSQSGKAIRQMTHTYSPKKFHNIKDMKDNQALLGADFSTNPVQQAYFAVWSGACAGGDPGAISCDVIIDYIVLCSEPKTLAQS